MTLIVICAVIGLWVRGFSGLIIGGAIGYAISHVARTARLRRLAIVQSEFLDSMFTIMGAPCKPDGVVTRDETKCSGICRH